MTKKVAFPSTPEIVTASAPVPPADVTASGPDPPHAATPAYDLTAENAESLIQDTICQEKIPCKLIKELCHKYKHLSCGDPPKDPYF